MVLEGRWVPSRLVRTVWSETVDKAVSRITGKGQLPPVWTNNRALGLVDAQMVFSSRRVVKDLATLIARISHGLSRRGNGDWHGEGT